MSFFDPPAHPPSSTNLPFAHSTHHQTDPASHPHALPIPTYPTRPSINPIHPDYRPLPANAHNQQDPYMLAGPEPPGSATARSNYSYSLYTLPASEVSVNRRWLEKMKGWAEDVDDDDSDQGEFEEGKGDAGGGETYQEGDYGTRSRKSLIGANRAGDRGSTLHARPQPDASFPTTGYIHPAPQATYHNQSSPSSHNRSRNPYPSSSFNGRMRPPPPPKQDERSTHAYRQSTILPFESISSRPTPKAGVTELPPMADLDDFGANTVQGRTREQQGKGERMREMRIGSMTFEVADSERGGRGSVGVPGARKNAVEDVRVRARARMAPVGTAGGQEGDGDGVMTMTGERIANRRLTAFYPEDDQPVRSSYDDAAKTSDRFSSLTIEDMTRRATAMNKGTRSRTTPVQSHSQSQDRLRHQPSTVRRFTPFPSEIPADLKALPPVPASTTASWTSPADHAPSFGRPAQTITSTTTVQTARKGIRRPAESTLVGETKDDSGWTRARAGTPWNSRPATMGASSVAGESKGVGEWEDVGSESAFARSVRGVGVEGSVSGATSRRAPRIDQGDAKADAILSHIGEAKPRKRYPDRATSRVVSGIVVPSDKERDTFMTARTSTRSPTGDAAIASARAGTTVKSRIKPGVPAQGKTTKARPETVLQANAASAAGAGEASPSSRRASRLPNETIATSAIVTGVMHLPRVETISGRNDSRPASRLASPRTESRDASPASARPNASLAAQMQVTPGASPAPSSSATVRPTSRGAAGRVSTMEALPAKNSGELATPPTTRHYILEGGGGHRSSVASSTSTPRLADSAPRRDAGNAAPRLDTPRRPDSTATWVTEPISPLPHRSRPDSSWSGRSRSRDSLNNDGRRLSPSGRSHAMMPDTRNFAGFSPEMGRRSDPLPQRFRPDMSPIPQAMGYTTGVSPYGPTFHPPMMIPMVNPTAIIPTGPAMPLLPPPGINMPLPYMAPRPRQDMSMLQARMFPAGFDPRAGMLRNRSRSDPYFGGRLRTSSSFPMRRPSEDVLPMMTLRSRPSMSRDNSWATGQMRASQRMASQRRPRVPQRLTSGVSGMASQRAVAAAAAERAIRKQERANIRAARMRKAAREGRPIPRLVVPVSGPVMAVRRPGQAAEGGKGTGLLKGLFKRS